MLLLLELLHQDGPLLVLAALVLKPDADHPGAEAGHLHQLLLHQSVRSWVGVVARPQGVELLLVQDRPNSGRLLRLFVAVVPVVRGMSDRHCFLGEEKGFENAVQTQNKRRSKYKIFPI